MDSERSFARTNGRISHWYNSIGDAPIWDPLRGDIDVDVAIAGAGYTGLWTAYYLAKARPELRIAIVERRFAGFGASGRNGGWLTDHFSAPPESMGRPQALAMKAAMQRSIDEIIEVAEREGIDADIVKSGILSVARGPAQDERLSQHLEHEKLWGTAAEDIWSLSSSELNDRLRVDGATSGAWFAHGARAQPAKLVLGLAELVAGLGVDIYENTAVESIEPGMMTTDRGRVRAPIVLSCLEGYTGSLAGQKRTLLPLNSAMIVTDPLTTSQWDRIGWSGNELMGDSAHAYCYAQRTADGRIAIGGRGVPYRYRSRIDVDGQPQESTVRSLVSLLHAYFPSLSDIGIAHAWCGVLGVPRDWSSYVRYDAESGFGTAGGYVGNGVTTSNLAGRTLRDLVLSQDTELTALPWVGHEYRRNWEVEPLRWIGTRTVYSLYREADRREQAARLRRNSVYAGIASRIAGR
ncbi:NAD(P)/FAD-dependent oxidoreductase [Rhodococcus sp. IEGM1428]|uniref:NAD(P)/FAD-dependent oxidoreductase n=1 Tax=Rhodococcus sp. IEGM1428 TaxID=3392191 RepID=UPI003D13EF7B